MTFPNLDASGNTSVTGPAPAGSPAVGNPVQIGGSDGTNIRSLVTDTTGRLRATLQTTGGAQDLSGAPASGVPGAVLFTQDFGGVSNPAIYDVTSAANTALDTGILDVSAWRSVLMSYLTSAGTSQLTLFQVDDSGSSFFTILFPTAAANGIGALGVGTGTAGFSSALPLPRRIRVTMGAAGVGNTVRLRIEGRR